MFWMKPKLEFTESSPRVVGFFFAQYVAVMRYGKDKDRTDAKMKRYLYHVCLELGIPPDAIEEEVREEDVQEEIAALPEPNVVLPFINRRTPNLSNGRLYCRSR